MKIFSAADWLAVTLLTTATLADVAVAESQADVDEVIVVGRSVSTDSAEIQVDREMLVDTASALKNIPGANVNANGPVTGIAQFRGMHGDRISVVIDHLGIVSGGPNAMDAPLSYVSPMITDELSVTRGIASVSLAPESIGGHISTKLARGEFSAGGAAFNGFIGTRYSGNGGISTSAGRLTLATDSHKFSLIAELDDGDDIDTPAGEVRPSRLHRERSDLSYSYKTDDASLLLFVGRLDTDDTGTPALPMDIRFIETNLFGAQAGLKFSDSLSVVARAARNDVEHLMDNFGLRQAPMAAMQRQNFTTGEGRQFSVSATVSRDDSEISFGLSASQADHNATISNPNNSMFEIANFADVQRDVTSVFGEWSRTSDRGDVEIGLRAKRVSADAGEVSASGLMGGMATNVALLAETFNSADRSREWNSVDVVLKYSVLTDAGAEWRVELGSKTRAPSYQEMYLWLPLQATGGLADGRSYIGGLQLAEERSNEIALGVGYTLGRLTVSPQVFFRSVDDYIQGVPSTNTTANAVAMMMSGAAALEFRNVDAEIRGADLAWKLELTDNWYLDGVASYVRGKRRDVQDNLYRLAPANASVALTWTGNNMSVTTELVGYARQKKVSEYNAEQATPGYGLVNAMMAWTPSESLRLEARADNLLDKAYQDHVAGINRAAGSDIAIGERLYGSGRSLSAGVIVRF